ncbi:MAG: beta-lactamase family protein [Clostridiales bacterium]|nr:beta-lactamase family protein [Clostridiales bacterium]
MTTTMQELERCTPEQLGVSSAAVSAFISRINAQGLGVQGFTLLRHGKVAAQCFWKPYAGEHPHVMYSMSKAVTSTAVGFAVSEGLLSLDDKVAKFFPEYEIKGENADLTVRHLLTMRSDKNITFLDNKGGTDWVQHFFKASFKCRPDTKFNYISENTFMLSAIVTRVTGETLVDYLEPRIFEPLGIEKPFWETDGKGVAAAGWGLYMRNEDIAKFFSCYIDGTYQGKQILPPEWVKEATACHTPTTKDGAADNVCGYGYKFWMNRVDGTYMADGLFGQRALILPEQDAVMAISSGQAEDYYVMDAFWDCFRDAFRDTPLEENPEAYQTLQAQIDACHVTDLPATQRNRALEQQLEGRTITCRTSEFTSVITISITQMLYNKPGKINEMKFSFQENSLRFTWREKDEVNTIEAGMDGHYGVSEMKLKDLHYTAYSKAAWQPDGSLKLWIRPIQTGHVRQFTFRFKGSRVKVINEMTPRFVDLAVYYLSFAGHPVRKEWMKKIIRGAVKTFGLPIIEPNFRGRLK